MGAANALFTLGCLYCTQSRNQEAEDCLNEAQRMYSLIGYDLGTGNALRSLGILCGDRHRYEEAQSFFCQALSAFARGGSCVFRAKTLPALAQIYLIRGNYLQAEESLHETLTIG
ncbi:hypothetical protein FRC01_013535, partial [Tulasnella sp. 417]